MAENHFDITPYNYVLNNPLIYIDPMGMDTVYILDQSKKPTDDTEYTAEKYVVKNGEINGPYEGSSFPDDEDANTLKEGEGKYNNKYGHSGGKRKGLNLVDDDGNRNAEGEDGTMTNVNIHDSFDENGRSSEGCPTVPHDDPDGFFDNFDWSGAYNGNSGTTGTSDGTWILKRGKVANSLKKELKSRKQYQNNPIQKMNMRKSNLKVTG